MRPAQYLSNEDGDPAVIVEHQMIAQAKHEKLEDAFGELDERAKETIRRRWLTEDKSTLHELASEFSVSAERIRQLEKNALKKLRNFIVTE